MSDKKPLDYGKILGNVGQGTINPTTNLNNGSDITNKSINTTVDQAPTKLPKINYENLLSNTRQKARMNQTLEPIKIEGFEMDDYDLVPEIRMHQGLEVVDRIRANNQRWYTQLGNFAGQIIIGEIFGGVVSGVGAIAEIPDMIRDLATGEGHVDFNNAILRAGNSISEWSREAMPIYEVNPNESFQMGDFGWWMKNGVSVASTLSMLIPGAAVVKGASYAARITKLADKVSDATKYYSKLAIGAGTMRHVENVRESFQVANDARLLASQQFEDDENFQNFINSESGKAFLDSYQIDKDNPEAKRLAGEFIAAKAGWRSYMINSTNIVFDLVQFAPLLRGFKVKTRNTFGKHHKLKKAAAGVTGKKAPGKFNWAISKLNPLVSATGRQLTEGIEEAINFIGSQEGNYLASNILGLESSNFSDRFAEYLQDGELWESAFWGVLGGMTFEGASGAAGRMLGSNNKGPQSLTGKISEINQRAAYVSNAANKLNAIQNRDPNYTDVTGEYNFRDITDSRREELIDDIRTDLAYNLGINASVAGNVDILLDQLKNPEFQQQLVDLGLTTQEDIDTFISEAEQNILAAEDAYKKHTGRFVTSSASSSVKNSLISKGVNLELQKKKIEKLRSKLEEKNGGLKLDDTTYSNIEGNTELALRREALKRSLAAFTIEAARADGLSYKTEAERTEAKKRYQSIINKIQNELTEIDKQINESGETLPSVKNIDERIIDNAAGIEGYKIAESVIAEDINKIKTKEAQKKEEQLQKEREEAIKQQGIDLANKMSTDESLGLTEDSQEPDILGAIKDKLLPIEKKLRESGQTEAADVIKQKIDELTDRLTSDEARTEVRNAKRDVKGDNQSSPTDKTSEDINNQVKDRDRTSSPNSEKITKANPEKSESQTEDNPQSEYNPNITINSSSPSPAFPEEPQENETEFLDVFTMLSVNQVIKDQGDSTVKPDIVKMINDIINLNVGDEVSIVKVGNDLEIRDGKNNLIGYINTVKSKQNLLNEAKERFVVLEKLVDVKPEFKSEMVKLADKIKGLENEIKFINNLNKLKPNKDGVIAKVEISSKLRGQVLNNIVNDKRIFRSINESFGKPISLFTNRKDNLKQLEIIHDADGKGSQYNGFMGSGNIAPMFAPGVIYTIITDNNGHPMAMPISTGNVDLKHAEFLFDIFVELATRMNKQANGKYVNDLRNKEIKNLKDLINEITYQGKKSGILVHNEKIEIPMSDGNVIQLFFRNKGKGTLKGSPVSNTFNMRVVTKDQATGKVKKVISDFNIMGTKDFDGIRSFVVEQLQNLKRQVNSKNLKRKGKYKSVLGTDLKSPNLVNNSESYDSYYDYITQDKGDDGLPVLRSDLSSIRNESGDILTHFISPRIRVSNPKVESTSGPTEKQIKEERERYKEQYLKGALDPANFEQNWKNHLEKWTRENFGTNQEEVYSRRWKEESSIPGSIVQSIDENSFKVRRYKKGKIIKKADVDSIKVGDVIMQKNGTTFIVEEIVPNENALGGKMFKGKLPTLLVDLYAQTGLYFTEKVSEEIIRKSPEATTDPNSKPPDVSSKDIIEGLKAGLGQQFITAEDVKGYDLSDDAFNKLSQQDINDLDDFLDRSVTEQDITEGYTKEDMDKAKAWWKTNLPNVPFEVVEGLIGEGRTSFGRFHNSMVYLSNVAKEGTAYHEGFHAAFHLYLNPVERSKLLEEAAKRYGEPSKEEIEKHGSREIALEEKMADEFMVYVMNGVEDKTWTGRIKSFFRNMYRYIKNLLGIGSNIDKLFYDINNAKFTYKADQKSIDYARGITLNRDVDGENVPDTTMPSEGFTDREESVLLNKLPGLYYAVNQKLKNNALSKARKNNSEIEEVKDDDTKAAIMSLLIRKVNSPATTSQHKANILRTIQALNNDDSDIWRKTKQIIAKDYNQSTNLDPEIDGMEFDDISELKRNWDDGATLGINQKSRVTGEVKSIIRMSQDIDSVRLDSDGSIEYVTSKDDFLGFPNFLDFDSVYPYLANHLAGVQNAQELLDRLEQLSKFDLSFMKIWEQINPEHLNIRQQEMTDDARQMVRDKKSILLSKFFVVFAKQSPNIDVDLVSERGEVLVHTPTRANRNNTSNILANKWVSTVVGKHKKKQIDVASIINSLKPMTNRLRNLNFLDNKNKKIIANDISNIFSQLGITLMEKGKNKMPEAIYDIIKDEGDPIQLIKFGNLQNVMQELFIQPLSWAVENLSKSEVTFDQLGSLRQLANTVRYFKYDIIQNTSVNVEGKKQYTITDSNFMSDFFAKYNSNDELQRLELIDMIGDMLDIPAMKDSNWLKQMILYNEDGTAPLRTNDGDVILNDEFFSTFSYSYEDGLKNTDNNLGVKYHRMEDSDWYFVSMAKFLNGSKKGWAKYAQPIPSDSSNLIYITAPVFEGTFYSSKEEDGTVNYSNNLNMNSSLGIGLFDLVSQEIKAMHQAQVYLFETDDLGNVILDENKKPIIREGLDMRTLQKDYHYKLGPNGEKILFDDQGYVLGEVFRFNSFPELSRLNTLQSNKSPEGKGFIKSESLGSKAIKSIHNTIQLSLEGEALSLMENPMFSGQVDRLWALAKTRYQNKAHFVMNFLGNQKISIVESQNWFSGNISEYKDKQDSSKRAKQTNSPGIKQSLLFTNPMFNVVVIKDIELTSPDFDQIINTLKDSFSKRKNYTKTESKFDIDNIRNSTPNSSLEKDVYKVARKYQRINTGDAQGYVSWARYKRQLKDNGMWNDRVEYIVEKIDNDMYISPNELDVIMQPLKGFYYNRSIDPKLGKQRSRQVKYSTVPLIPQLIKGTDLEILEDKMRVLDIDEVIFESASKVGTLSVHKIHNEEGRIQPEVIDDLVNRDALTIERLDNQHWYKQQDVPTKFGQEGKLGTQIKDIILTNLSNSPIYKVAFSEADMTGKQLLNKYFDLAVANIVESSTELLEELGAKVDEGGNVIFENNKKIRSILLRELVKRGANENYIKAILPKPGTDQFTLPLSFSGMNSKFESLLLSLFTNKVTDQKFPGFSAVQFSGAFFRTNKKASELTQAVNEERMQGVEWINGHDPSQRLKATRDSESGIITAEVVVARPELFKYKDGTPIPINELDPELLEMISYRIPTEAKHSMVVFKVVGFTPKATGDIIILPDDIIAQTGSDFDIDKMQVMMYTPDSDGKKIQYDNSKSASDNNRKQRNNAILDIFTSILKNKHHLAEMLETGSFDDLMEIRKEMDELDGMTEKSLDISSFSGQDEIRKRNMSGRTLKGISASFNKFGAVAQNIKLSLNPEQRNVVFGYKLIETDSETGVVIKRDVEQLKKRYGSENVVRDGEFVYINHHMIGWTKDGSHLNVNGDLVLKHSAQGITAAVDIGKDPTFNSFNVKAFTYPAVGVATLLGIPWKNVAWLTKQPIVKQLQDTYYESRGLFGTNSPVSQLIKDIENQYLNIDSSKNNANHGLLFGLLPESTRIKLNKLKWQAIKGKINWPDFYEQRDKMMGLDPNKVYSKEELKDLYLAGQNFDLLSPQEKLNYYRSQLEVLYQFENLRRAGNQANQGVRLLRIDTKGAGPTMTGTHNFEKLLSDIGSKEDLLVVKTDEDGKVYYENAADAVYPSYFDKLSQSVYPPLDAMYKNSNSRSIESVGQFFLEEHPRFRNFLASIMETLKGRGFMYNDKIEAIVKNWLSSYLLKDADLFNDMDINSIKDLLGISTIDERQDSSLAQDIADIQEEYPELTQHQGHILAFLNPKINSEEIDKNGGMELLDILDMPKDPIIQDQISRSLLKMYRGTSLNADGNLLPEDLRNRLKDIAIKIAKYEFFVSGYNFGFNSLTEIIPTEMKTELGLADHFEKKLQEFKMVRNFNGDLSLVHNVIRANWKRNIMVPRVKTKSEVRNVRGAQMRAPKKGTGNWTPGRDGIIVTNDNLSNEPLDVQNSLYIYAPKYIVDKKKTRETGEPQWKLVSNDLYMRVGKDELNGLLYYIPVPKLGVPGRLIEFGGYSNEVTSNSILPSNEPSSYKDTKIPYNNEVEARDYVSSILNGDTNRSEVIKEIKEQSKSESSNNTLDFYEQKGKTFLEVVKEAEIKNRTGGKNLKVDQQYEGDIVPDENTIFVFGSNPEGKHGAGAAKIARDKFGAKYGQGEGLQGQSYALPTKDLRVKENRGFKSISPEQITESIKSLYKVAKQNPNKQFKVAYRNTTQTSLNGYTGLEMIDMFNDAGSIPSNMIFSKEWIDTGKLNINKGKNLTLSKDDVNRNQDMSNEDMMNLYRQQKAEENRTNNNTEENCD